MSLQNYLAQEVKLTDGELKHLTEIFAKMFTDSHTKGMALFLDTLHDVILLKPFVEASNENVSQF